MKKLITIIASALTLGAFAGQENVPVAFDTSSVPVGTEVNVEADGVVFATANTTGRSFFALLPDGATSCGLKLAGEVNNTVIDTDFTAATACPIGWTALSYRASEGRTVTFNTTGATATNWDQASIYTDCSITPDVETTIDVVTSATGSNNNLVLYLASSEYSVLIGNSYNDDATKKVRIGEYDGDATAKFASFQSADGRAVPASSTVIAETADIDVGKPLSYHLVISGTTITGTVTGTKTASDPAESVTKEISFTLPTEYSFTKFGIDIDGKSSVSVQSVTIKNDQEPPAREPTEITLVNFDFDSYTKDGEAIDMIDGDTVVISANTENGSGKTKGGYNHDAWHATDDDDVLAGHPVIIQKGMNWKWSVSTMSIADNVSVFYFAGSKNLNSATITGEGTFVTQDGVATVSGNTTITSKINAINAFKLANGATLKVATKLDDGKVTTDVENVRIDYDAGTKTYSLVNTYTIKIKAADNTKVQYRNHEDDEWIDAPEAVDGFHTIISGGVFYFQYVALDGYTVTGDQSGLKYTSNGGITANTTYNPATLPITVTANVTQEDVDLMVENVSESILDLINGALSVEVDTVNGVTITITGAATLEGLAESTAKTTLVGDGTHKPVTIPEIGSKKAGFYKVEATTAK